MHRPKNVDENQKKNETLASQNKQKSKPISQIMKKKKEIKDQLNTPLETLRQDAPIEPNWGIKKNSDGKNTF
ncbi:mRNA-degrading endonuclease YafQ of YafQ-DinJ toxin-antitoxin module [Lysinibacillus sp. TE18511]